MQTLKKYSEKLKENAPKSYEGYLNSLAKRGDVSYYDALRAAKTKKAKGGAAYGASGSALLSAGLADSGYRDYLESLSDASFAHAGKSAEGERELASYRERGGYEKYLSAYNSLQTKISEELIREIAEGYDFSTDRALERAVAAGLSDTLAYSTATEAVRQAKLNAYNEAVTFAKLNKLSPKRAKEYAKNLGLDEKDAERVYDEISLFNKNERGFLYSMSANQYYNYILSKSKK